ncbi:MAG: LPS-assembly protein LptD [Ottowia sp.]|nr:LPS-assembly protein LptD [Ottowia sp.]
MTLPYYVNIASNRDFIFKPRLLSKRGMQLATEFRYLAADYNGVLQAEYLPEDRIARRNRWFYNVQHSHQIGPDWKTYINAAKVSDDNYPGDLGQSSSTAVQQQFTQELGVSYTHGNWTTLARVQKFQTLAPNPPAVNRVPQLNVLYRDKNVEGWVFQAETDVSQFKYPVAPVAGTSDGMRVFVKPELRYVWRTPNYFVIPKISLNASAYDLSQPMQIGGPTSITRTLPSVSVDAGLAFVRAADEWTGLFGRDIEQTLEPRIFYVYTPFRDQSQIPIFDTASADFNLTQIFSEQPFYGNDRIADNNKVTVGVTSRLLALAGGEELASFTLAQRFDMQGQRVTINSTNYSAKQSYSDVLAGASVNFFSDLSLGSTVQYTLVSRQLQASNLDLSWKPGQRRVLNFSYSYQRPNDVIGPVPLRQIVASGQWPVFAQFDLLARANYDRAGRKMVDSMLGLQYDAGCWIGRFVVQRFTNLSQRTNTNFFFQVEFKGLSQGLGSANNIFKLYVPGYTPLSARPADLSSHEINY